MAENEEKGFVLKDRRKVSLDELDKESKPEEAGGKIEEEEEKAKEKFEEAARKSRERGGIPLPEVSFSTFVLSLSSSALLHLGEIPNPESQRTEVDLPMAKQIIDTLGMLQEKTSGNLDADEDHLVKTVLYDLRLRYVQRSKP